MSITIGVDENGKPFVSSQFDNYDKDAELTEYEEKAVSYIKKQFEKENIPFDTILFRRRSKNYLSLVTPTNNDFCRIKAGPKSAWYSLDMWGCAKELQEHTYFSDVTNKNQRHWKLNLKSIDEFESAAEVICFIYQNLTSQEE